MENSPGAVITSLATVAVATGRFAVGKTNITTTTSSKLTAIGTAVEVKLAAEAVVAVDPVSTETLATIGTAIASAI